MGHLRAEYVLLLCVFALTSLLGAWEGRALAQGQESPLFEPLLDTAGHRLAEGDYLLAQFYDGIEQQEYYPQVDAAGQIKLPLIDAVNVAGLTLREAAELLTQKYRIFYHRPYVSLQLLRKGRFELFIFGPDHPGKLYTMDNGAHLLDILSILQLAESGMYRRIHVIRGDFDFKNLVSQTPFASSGPATGRNMLALPSPAVARSYSSLADQTNWRAWIEARRNDPDTQVWVIDPLRLTVEGELSSFNVELRNHDVIFIPTPERFVDIYGVAVPGRYELLGDEKLGDVIRMAGTVNYHADLVNTVINRYDDCGHSERVIFNLFPALDDPSSIEDFELQNRDQIQLILRERRVFVLGSVNLAGAFDFSEDATVLDYIAQAGGETADAHLAWIAIIRQQRDRLDPHAPAQVIQANFKEIHKGLPLCTDLSLMPGDVIYVPPKGFEFNLPVIIQAVGTAVTAIAVVDNALNRSGSSNSSPSE